MLTKTSLFKPSKVETKADATTLAARQVIEAATAERHEKQRRLKAARLEKEAADKAAAPPPAPAKRTRKAAPAKTPGAK